MTWVALANTNTCRIYHYDGSNSGLSLLKEISHPEFKEKTGDAFTTDRPGHYHSAHTARGSYEPHQDLKGAAIERFVKEVAEALNQGRVANAYQKLIVVTSPSMTGLLSHQLNKHVSELISHHIQKDCQHLSDKELSVFLKEETKFPG